MTTTEALLKQFNLLTEAEQRNFVSSALDNDPSHSQLVQDFMRLSKARQQDFLLKALRDSAWRKTGAGVDDNAAEKNRASMKADGGTVGGTENKNTDAVDHEKDILRNAMKETFGVSDAALDQLVTIVEHVTDGKATDETRNGLLAKLNDLFGQYGGFFLDDDEADLVEQLCNHIEWLETEIAAAEDEAEQLRREIEGRLQRQGAANESIQRPQRKAKRSFIEEDMLTPDEENAIFLEDNNKHHPNRVMQQYLDRIDRDAAYVKKS